MANDSTSAITHDDAAGRFETVVDGVTAELDYRRTGDLIELTHTGVPKEIGGRGVAGRLMEAAVDLAKAENLTVVPSCSYARHWLDAHPDAAATVKIG